MDSSEELEESKLLATVLQEGRGPARLEALAKLQGIHPWPEGVVAALTDGLKTRDPVLRLRIAQLLRQAGSSVLPALLESLQSKDVTLRRAVAAVLGQMGPSAQAAIPALKEALHDKEIAPEVNDALRKIAPHTSLVSQLDHFFGRVMAAVLVIAIMLVLVGVICHVFREATQVVTDVAVGFCLIGSSLGSILGGTRWGRLGAVLGAFVLGLGGALMGAGIGYVAGSLFDPILHSIHPNT